MADDIVTRLRNHANWLSTTEVGEICDKAADKIERLSAAGDALVDAMKDRTHRSRSKSIQVWKEARRG